MHRAVGACGVEEIKIRAEGAAYSISHIAAELALGLIDKRKAKTLRAQSRRKSKQTTITSVGGIIKGIIVS